MSESTFTQTQRHLAITTPLGADKVILMAMHGNEALGRLFQYELDLFSEREPIDPEKILGKNVDIRLNMLGDKTRYFNGFISRLSLVGIDDTHEGRRLFSYRASMVPWLWFLTRHADCRIFQEKTIPDILKTFFTQSTEYKLSGTYKPKEYCVQYRETDFNFVSRLMENEGIYYYFKHEEGKHTLIVCDAASSHEKIPDYETLLFHEPSSDPDTDAYIWDWSISQEVTPTKHSLTDFNPLQPSDALLEQDKAAHSYDSDQKFEIFDYPGGYMVGDEGRVYATTRKQEAEAQFTTAHSSSSARAIHAGAIFKLDDHPVCESEDYLITAIHYQLRNDTMGLGYRAGGEPFRCEFTAIPNKNEFRPARSTPKPFVQGPQTAIVAGKAGDEITTDEYARVKVKFHWDRDPEKHEKSSCWIRVSQNWAGKEWGGYFIPRIGQEVIVDFLEGDPDRPIITGRVYNGEQMPPYSLPENKTQSGVKTRSTTGGTTDNFNEIRFEDKKGSEEVYVHAEKDMNRVVENNDTLKVGSSTRDKGDQTIEIFNNQSITVGAQECSDGSRTDSVWNSETITIGAGKGQAADGSQTVEIWKDRTVTIDTGNDTLELKQGDQTTTIDTGDQVNTVKTGDQTNTVKTGNQTNTVSMGNHSTNIDMGNHTTAIKMGNQTIKCDLGSISGEAMQGIEIKVGANSIKVDQMGVTITGMMVKIEGQVQTEVKGLMCQVSGDAMLQAKGGITMIG